MTSFSPVTRFVGLLVLPPALATLVAHGVWSLGGGEARCAAELDLSTPGFICAGGLDLLLSAALLTGFHVLVGMPLAWWAARRRLAVGPILRRLAVIPIAPGGSARVDARWARHPRPRRVGNLRGVRVPAALGPCRGDRPRQVRCCAWSRCTCTRCTGSLTSP